MNQSTTKTKGTAETAAKETVESAFELPASVREMAEKGLDQSRDAYNRFRGAAEEAAGLMEDQAQRAADSATTLNLKAIDFAETNMKATFELARKMLASKDLSQAFDLQAEFARKQMETLNGQAREFSEIAQKATTEAVKPYQERFEKGVSEMKTSMQF